MRRCKLGIAALLLVGCGGSVDRSHPAEGFPTGAGGVGVVDGGGGVGPEIDGGRSGAAGSGGSGGIYVDPGCPDAAPIEGTHECDPFATVSNCPAGLRCIPYVEYADDCGREAFGTRCIDEGFGVQGDPCADGTDCAALHVCVTTGEGNQCVRLCDPDNGSSDCPSGLLCWWLDVQGTNVCF